MGLLNWLKSRLVQRPSTTQDAVFFDEQGVRFLSHDGTVGSVRWDDLRAVFIDTTDTGPFVEDVFFVLVAEAVELAVPQGAAGVDRLLERLGRLRGFDHDAVCRAMCYTDNNRFVCWKCENATKEDLQQNLWVENGVIAGALPQTPGFWRHSSGVQ